MTAVAQQAWQPTARWLLAGAVLSLAILPALPLVVSSLASPSARVAATPAFIAALKTSLLLAIGVALLSLAIGLPLGLLAALYRFPARWLLVPLVALPLLLPSFLPCIGWSNLAARNPPLLGGAGSILWLPGPGGFAGCVFVLGLQLVPLPFFAAWSACRNLTASQIDAARLHGGEVEVFRQAARACVVPAVFAALFAGVLSLSDPGAPLILGCRSVAVEIRTSFSALRDYELAGRQCLLLAAVVLLVTTPMLVMGLPSLAAAVLARQTRPALPVAGRPWSQLTLTGLAALLTLTVVLPGLGLCLPVLSRPMLGRAWEKVASTAGPTVQFAGGAGLVAVALATVLALAVTGADEPAAGRARAGRLAALGVLLGLLALPPALGAIGVARMASSGPAQLDWLTRGRLTVVLVLGLRFMPVAAVVMMRAAGSLSLSWIEAGRMHGVGPVRLLAWVVLPNLAAALVAALLLGGVLAAGDITTTHLLQPSGVQTLPVGIFTVMANSPEGLVASLCLLYLGGVAIGLGAVACAAVLWRRNTV